MAYEQVQKPSSSFVAVQKKVSEFAPSASRVQAKEVTAGEQEQMPLGSTPATDANWLMKHPLFKGNQFLQRVVAPASEPESLESQERLAQRETVQRQEESNETATPHSLPVQAKLTIGEPGDKYEQEADRVASQVVKQINSPEAASSSQGQSVQRQEEPVEELQAKPSISDLQRSPLPLEVQREAMPAEEELQAKSILQRREAIAGGDASTDLDTAINSARGGGQPLDAGLQRSMGQAMGADFSGVKVHTDAQSDQLNQSIQAKAFTTGQDVFFRQGEYNPGSRGGQELIAHELTHVVQQNPGSVKPPLQKKGKVNVTNDAGSEKEADVMGIKASTITTGISDTNLSFDRIQFKPIIQRVKFANGQGAFNGATEQDAQGIKLDTVLCLAQAFGNAMITEDGSTQLEADVNFWRSGSSKRVRLTLKELEIIRYRAEKHKQYLDKSVAENPHTILAMPENLQLRHERLTIKEVRKANRIAGLIRAKCPIENVAVVMAVNALENYVLYNIDPRPILKGILQDVVMSNPNIPLLEKHFNKFLLSAYRILSGSDINHLEAIVDKQEKSEQGRQFKKVIAHRGDGATFDKMGGLLPRDQHNTIYNHENENSEESTRKALTSWTQAPRVLSGIECDIHLTKDDVPIVSHTSNIDALMAQEAKIEGFATVNSNIRDTLSQAVAPRFMTLSSWLGLIEAYVSFKAENSVEAITDRLRIEIEMKHNGLLTEQNNPDMWRSTEKVVSQFLKRSRVSHLMDIAMFNNSSVPALRHQNAKSKTALSQITYASGGAPIPELKEVRFGMHQKGIVQWLYSGALDGKIVTFAPGLDHPGAEVEAQLEPVKGLSTQLDVTIEQSIQSARHKKLIELMELRKSSGEGLGPIAIHTLTDHGATGANSILSIGLKVGRPNWIPANWTTDQIRAKHKELTDQQIRTAVQQSSESNNPALIGEILISQVKELL